MKCFCWQPKDLEDTWAPAELHKSLKVSSYIAILCQISDRTSSLGFYVFILFTPPKVSIFFSLFFHMHKLSHMLYVFYIW